MATDTQNQKPVHKIKVGSVQASIWLQTPENGEPFYTVTLFRLISIAALMASTPHRLAKSRSDQ